MAIRGANKDRVLTLQIAALVAAGLLLVGLMLGALMLQTNVQAWLLAHYRWVHAQTTMIDALEIYAVNRDPHFMDRARESMQVPMAARNARIAAERDPVDMKTVRAGLREMGMNEADIDGMAWLYFNMGRWPYLRDSIAIWLKVDPDIDRLAAIGTAMEADNKAGRLTPVRAAAYRKEIAQIRTRIDGYTWDFSNMLVSGLRTLRVVLIASTVLLLGALTLLFGVILSKVVGRIRSSEGWLRASFEQANVGMLQLDAKGAIQHANSAASRLLGLGVDECRHRRLQDFIVDGEQARFIDQLERGISVGGGVEGDTYMLESASGRHQIVRASISEVDADHALGRHGTRFAMIEDVTEAHAMRAELSQRARFDHLTGLLNRGELKLRIDCALRDLREGRIADLSVCLIDLDRFRHINHSAGQRVGDRILQVIAHRLHEAVGDAGEVGRLGSDQFVLVLPGMESGQAMEFAARIAEAISRPDKELSDSTMTPTASIGVVAVDRRHANASEVLADADTACERAKQAGRNRVRLLTRDDVAESGGRNAAECVREIRAAIAHGRLEMHAQRIVPCHPGGRSEQAELLLRMRDSEGVEFMPADFMPVAEMYGLNVDIDRQVLLLATEAIRAHRKAGGPPLLLFVNISASSVGEPEFGLFVRHLLDGEPGLAQMLCLEITETGVMANLAQATAFMDMVRQRGCRMALDDFGTGHSSLAHLRVLPVDIVKLDGSFVRDIDRDATSEVLIRSICQMSHVLGKRTVLEWVERREDAPRMCALGADYMQGFGLHLPEPLADYLASVQSSKGASFAGAR